MISLQGAIKWAHEGSRYMYFLIKYLYLICISVKEIVLYTGKSPLEAPLYPVRYLSVTPC